MSAQRWSASEANAWYEAQPWLVGCNFIPSTASNQLEMWQAPTFDIDTIDRELGWAAGLGFNTARVFLHDLLWQEDAAAFLARVDRVLDLAAAHSIRPLLVLFDGVWDPRPKLGPQRSPRPNVHNSRWVQSPGAAILGDPSRHQELQDYVSGVIGHFRDDERVLAWDLFNEPDNPNPAYARHEVANKDEAALALLQQAFDWARAAGPRQPLTAGVWRGKWAESELDSDINKLMLTESDVISFHSYEPEPRLRQRIDDLQAYGRPLLLTEFMSRGTGSTFEAVLPLASERMVAAYNWGLVAGRTQTQFPWDSWTKAYGSEPPLWFHDILRIDGAPYDPAEPGLIRRLTATSPA